MADNIITCIAIDDEPLALEVIRKFCARIGGIDLLTFTDPNEGLAVIRQQKPMIAFLDIQMENVNGLEIASQLPEETCFIFTTAFLNYALEGFNLDAVDYLHKPFAFERFKTAFNKALRRIGNSRDISMTERRTLTVKQEYNNVVIPLSEIAYIEAMEGYVKIFRDNGVCTITRMILKNIGEQLPADNFIRIHRSFIVSKTKIKSFNKKEIELTNGTLLPIGRQYVASISL